MSYKGRLTVENVGEDIARGLSGLNGEKVFVGRFNGKPFGNGVYVGPIPAEIEAKDLVPYIIGSLAGDGMSPADRAEGHIGFKRGGEKLGVGYTLLERKVGTDGIPRRTLRINFSH